MKQRVFITLLILIMLPLIALPLLDALEWSIAGKISIGDIHADILTAHEAVCGCCPALWSGGIATTLADLSEVQVWDTAEIVTLDGGHYVLECAEIVPCIRIGNVLIGWRGIVEAEGDVLIYSKGTVYRFVRL